MTSARKSFILYLENDLRCSLDTMIFHKVSNTFRENAKNRNIADKYEKKREREYEERKNENQNGNLCIVERTYISILRFTCQIGNINSEVEPRKRNTYRPKNTLIDNELNYTINCKRKDDGDDGTEKKCFSSSNPSE